MATLHLEIVTQERRLFSEDVDMVVAPGSEGELGILPHHAPLLTTLKEGELRVKKGGNEEYFTIGGGFMEVQPDHVIVLADVAEQANEIDIARAEEAARRDGHPASDCGLAPCANPRDGGAEARHSPTPGDSIGPRRITSGANVRQRFTLSRSLVFRRFVV